MLATSLRPALFYLALSGIYSSATAAKPKDAILLSEVQSLTLRADRQTSNRRVPAIPQLKCISPRGLCALHKIDTMRCVNQGAGYGPEDIQWSCTASLPRELKLGSTDVICEGYSSPDDPYVLRGSCGVEYRLVLTDEGARRHPDLDFGGDAAPTMPVWLFWILFLAIFCWILYGACTSQHAEGRPFRAPRPRGNFWGGGGGGGGPGFWGGGGGGGGWNEPPPPYPGTKPSGSGGWQPGFWSGLAGGAAAGYMAGSRGRGNNDVNRGYGSFGSDRAWGGSSRGSSWGGSGGAGPSSSSSRYESTGFGSTNRR